MKKNHLFSYSKICTLALLGVSALFLTSCAEDGYDNDERFDAGVSNTQMEAVKADDISHFGDTIAIPVYFKGAYALDAGTVYLKFLDDNMKASDFAGEFELGFDGNLGAIAYNVAANYNVTSKAFAVPFWVRLSF